MKDFDQKYFETLLMSTHNICFHGEMIRKKYQSISVKKCIFFSYGLFSYNFVWQGTEELLKKESGISDADVKQETTTPSESEVSHALAAYKRFA